MVAQGMLNNPALFTGAQTTPVACVQDWLDLSVDSGMTFQCFHHHLVFMTEKILTKEQRRVFNKLKSVEDVTDFLVAELDVSAPSGIQEAQIEVKYNDSDGKYFRSRTKQDVDNGEILNDSWFCV